MQRTKFFKAKNDDKALMTLSISKGDDPISIIINIDRRNKR